MTARVQGGTAGILAAIASGRLDPLCAALDEERRLRGLTPADRRKIARRDARRVKSLANRTPF